MSKNSFALSFILISITLVSVARSDDGAKLQDVLRRNPNSKNYNNTEEDVLKYEAMKVLRKCQTDGSDNRKNDSGYDSGYGRSYGYNDDNTRGSDYMNGRYSSNYDYTSYDNNNNRNNRHYNNGDRSSSNSKNCTDRGFGGSDSDSNYDGYRKNKQDTNNYNTYREGGSGFERNYFSSRIRREERRNTNNDQCVSQCVFGYMNLVDEDQTPSETLTIKWLQDHMANKDLKRIKALREARRCFAKLTTSDIEDGCEFSKELSNCLNLDIE